MIFQKHSPCVFSTALDGGGFFDAPFCPVTAESVGWKGASKKFRMRNELKNSLMTALRGLGLFLISFPSHAFTCASITGQTITIISINQVTCASGEVAFLETADLTSWQILLANAVLASQPFDYVLAGAFWAFAFSFTVGIWFFAKNMGMILAAIKHW